jgi:uncharacterized protein (TIGR03545 family)
VKLRDFFQTRRKKKDKTIENTIKPYREKVEKEWESGMSSWLDDISGRTKEKVDVSSVYDKDKLKSIKALNAAEESFKEVKETYAGIDDIDGQKESDNLKNNITALKSIDIKDEKDIKAAKDKIEKAQKSIEESETFIEETNKKRKDFTGSMGELNDDLKYIEEARKEDYSLMMSKLKLPSIEIGDIAETLFGSLVVDKFNKITGTIKKVREHIPPKKEKEKTVKKERDRGADIIFRKDNMYPPFLIKEIQISGGDKFVKVNDLTTTQDIHGKPLTGECGTKNFNLKAIVDH